MPSTAQRLLRLSGFLALQASLWVVLMFAFATMIEVAGWDSWNNALFFSATQWLPWAVIAPAVFWLAGRFPLERGHLLRSVPMHALACLSCSIAAVGLSAYFAPAPRLPGAGRSGFGGELHSSDGRGAERGSGDHMRREWRSPEKIPPPSPATGADASPPASPAAAADTPGSPGAQHFMGRDPQWWRNREGIPRGGMSRGALRDHGGFGPGPYRGSGGTGGPVAPVTGVPSLLRRWAFLGSFWPPFSSTYLRVNFSAALYLIIACVAHAVGYYRSAKDREAQALSLAAGLNRAKLDALRLQLQPHFLFNTLNAISTLVHRSPAAADELIVDLSELLRLSLQTAEHEVPLARELELLDCYLAIEQTRLGDGLRIVRDIDPAARAVAVPTFMLQPLAENAIRHGLEPRAALGTLTISAHREGENLRLVVADDGVGIGALGGSTLRRGVGLANTEQRLRALYGDAAQLEIVAPETGGVEVRLLLPVRPAPAAGPAPRTATT